MNLKLINNLIANENYIIKQYGYNEVIHNNQITSNKLYFIKKGVVTINQIDKTGENKILLLLGPTEYFGLKSIMYSYIPDPIYSISKSNETIIYEFHKSVINKYLNNEILLNEDIGNIILQRMYLLEKRIDVLIKPNIKNRLYGSLLDIENRIQKKLSEDLYIDQNNYIFMNQSEWGCYCRGARENICKAAGKLAKKFTSLNKYYSKLKSTSQN